MTQTVTISSGTEITWLNIVEVVQFEHRPNGRIFVWVKVELPSGDLTDLTVEGHWRTALVTDKTSRRAIYMPSLTFELLDPVPVRMP
jgi:hypothetical protein